MKLQVHYGSHLPVLIKLVQETSGDIAEIGTGLYSSFVLHWMCVPQKRMLYSYDNDKKYINLFELEKFGGEYHKIIAVDDWDKADLDRDWGLVFIDHKPAERRKVEAKRLSNKSKYLILHDTDGRNEKHYHYNEIYPLFKYRYDYTDFRPHTTVLSNFVDLSTFRV